MAIAVHQGIAVCSVPIFMAIPNAQHFIELGHDQPRDAFGVGLVDQLLDFLSNQFVALDQRLCNGNQRFAMIL